MQMYIVCTRHDYEREIACSNDVVLQPAIIPIF